MADLEVRDVLHSHNETVLKNLEKGDLVEIKRSTWKIHAYSHWAVYIGDGMVIHLTVDENDGSIANVESVSTVCCYNKSKGIVKVDGFWDATCGSKAIKNNDKDGNMRPLKAEKIVERAIYMIDKKGYNALWNNCEHFTSYCRYGISKSDQADTVKFLLKRVGYKAARGAIRKIIAHVDNVSEGVNLAVVGIDVLAAVLQFGAKKVFVGTTLAVVVTAVDIVCGMFANTDKVSWREKLAVVGIDVLADVLQLS